MKGGAVDPGMSERTRRRIVGDWLNGGFYDSIFILFCSQRKECTKKKKGIHSFGGWGVVVFRCKSTFAMRVRIRCLLMGASVYQEGGARMRPPDAVVYMRGLV